MTARRLTDAELTAEGIRPVDVWWVDAVTIGRIDVGLAGFWRAGRAKIALVRSNGAHALALPALVRHLLTAEPVIYITATDPTWRDYCIRAGGVFMGSRRTNGDVYALSRQRCPWWSGVRDPDNLPALDAAAKWVRRGLKGGVV